MRSDVFYLLALIATVATCSSSNDSLRQHQDAVETNEILERLSTDIAAYTVAVQAQTEASSQDCPVIERSATIRETTNSTTGRKE